MEPVRNNRQIAFVFQTFGHKSGGGPDVQKNATAVGDQINSAGRDSGLFGGAFAQTRDQRRQRFGVGQVNTTMNALYQTGFSQSLDRAPHRFFADVQGAGQIRRARRAAKTAQRVHQFNFAVVGVLFGLFAHVADSLMSEYRLKEDKVQLFIWEFVCFRGNLPKMRALLGVSDYGNTQRHDDRR